MGIILIKNFFFVAIFIDVILAILSFYFSFTLLRRKGDKIAFNFGMATLCLGFWLSTLAISFLSIIPSFDIFLVNLAFIFGIGILHFFYVFTLYFPVIQYRGHRYVQYVVSFVTLSVALSALIPGLFGVGVTHDRPLVYIQTNPIGLSLYTLYFALLSILIATNLRRSFKGSNGHYRDVIKKIGISAIFAVIVNLILSITIFYVLSFDLAIIGALTTSVVIYYIYLILYRK